MEDPLSKRTNGRWTRDEHLRFLQGLRIHGKNWKKIEQLVSTRNGSQIRSHAQKFFLKMQQAGQGDFDEQGYTDDLPEEGQEPTLISTLISKEHPQHWAQREDLSFYLGKIMAHWEGKQSLDFWSSLIDQKPPKEERDKQEKGKEEERDKQEEKEGRESFRRGSGWEKQVGQGDC